MFLNSADIASLNQGCWAAQPAGGSKHSHLGHCRLSCLPQFTLSHSTNPTINYQQLSKNNKRCQASHIRWSAGAVSHLCTFGGSTCAEMCRGGKLQGAAVGRKPPLGSDHFRHWLVGGSQANPQSTIIPPDFLVVNIILVVKGRLRVRHQDQTTKINHTGSHISPRCTTFV